MKPASSSTVRHALPGQPRRLPYLVEARWSSVSNGQDGPGPGRRSVNNYGLTIPAHSRGRPRKCVSTSVSVHVHAGTWTLDLFWRSALARTFHNGSIRHVTKRLHLTGRTGSCHGCLKMFHESILPKDTTVPLDTVPYSDFGKLPRYYCSRAVDWPHVNVFYFRWGRSSRADFPQC